MSVRGVFGGLLALTMLQAVLSSSQSAERTAGLWAGVTSGFARFMSPTVAAIPDLRERAKFKDVAPGPDDRVPYTSASGGSTTMPADWTTKAAAPRSLAV